MNNPFEALITWLWDASGNHRQAQEHRLASTHVIIDKNAEVRKRALKEIKRTQDFISDRQGT